MDPISALRLSPMATGGINPAQIAAGGMNLPQVTAPNIPTQELASLGSVRSLPAADLSAGRPFSDFLNQMVSDVNAKQASATETVQGVLAGENIPLHQAVIAVEEASVSFQLMVEVRNKLLESYQELMRMQI